MNGLNRDSLQGKRVGLYGPGWSSNGPCPKKHKRCTKQRRSRSWWPGVQLSWKTHSPDPGLRLLLDQAGISAEWNPSYTTTRNISNGSDRRQFENSLEELERCTGVQMFSPNGPMSWARVVPRCEKVAREIRIFRPIIQSFCTAHDLS